jgi:hypothetical protein
MTTSLAPQPKLQFFDANGVPLSGGKLYTYAAGTTTPLASYTNYGGGTPNANPVVLDSRGEASVWLGTSMYKMVLKSATDVEIWTVDNLNGADAATVASTLATLAASGGANLIGYASGVSSPIAQTVQDKLRQLVNVLDYGAVGNGTTDDTAAIQAAIDEMEGSGNGGVVYIPQGRYKLTSNLTLTWPHCTTEDSANAVVIRGDGSGLTILLDYRTSVANGGCVSYDFSGYTEAEVNSRYMLTWTGGFSIIRMVNYTTLSGLAITPGTGVGLYLNSIPTGTIRDVQVKGHDTCIRAINCLGNSYEDVTLSQANVGLSMYAATPVTPGGLAATPNAVVVSHCTINICKSLAVDFIGGSVEIFSSSFAFNGLGGIGAIRCIPDADIEKTLTVDHCFFESNSGLADVYVDASTAFASGAVSVSNCSFVHNITSSGGISNATHMVMFNVGSSAVLDTTLMGNGFKRLTAPAGGKYISYSGAGADNARASLVGNTYDIATEGPLASGTDPTASIFSSIVIQQNAGAYSMRIAPVPGSAWLTIADALMVISGSGGGMTPVSHNSEYLGSPAATGTTRHWAQVLSKVFSVGDTEVKIQTGSGAPSGADGAPIGTLYLNTAGGASTTLYVKTGASTYTAK